MTLHRTRVGLHGRNDRLFTEHDYSLVRTARIETLKTMSFTDMAVYDRLRRENADLEFIVRLYDERLSRDARPSPAEFAAKMVPTIKRLRPYAAKFEIHNEPNHADGIEGWGASDDNARAFREWYLQVLRALKTACPWAKFGFPGLALNHPHRDLEWLEICGDAIRASDWLGCHCYWQFNNMLKTEWGLRFKLYNERFPDKPLEITEFNDSTPGLAPEKLAAEHAQYYQELNKYAYLGSASSFIASSPDPAWAGFVWMKEGGQMLPVVHAVQAMPRQPVEVQPRPTPPAAPAPVPAKEGRIYTQTGKTVRGGFLEFLDRYGLDICGYPITDQFQEEGLPVQFFQRLALEEYASGKVRLKLIGVEAWYARDKIKQLQAEVQRLLDSGAGGGRPIQPAIEDLIDKLPTLPDKPYPTRALAEISQIVIHHTATSPAITAQRLADYQVKQLGWPGIGYHFFVAEDGRISQTNRLETVSNHAHEQNQESVGVCFAGTFTDVIPTAAQLRAGGQLCAWLLDLLHLTPEKLVGLCEFHSTQSPGSQWLGDQRWKDRLLAEVAAAPRSGPQHQSALVAKLQAQIKALKGMSRDEGADSALSESAPALSTSPVSQISAPLVQDVIDKLPKHTTKQYSTRKLTAVENLVIHHTAVAAMVGPKQVARYHVENLGWPGIGYHFMVSADGSIYQTNRLETVSYHTGGFNGRSVGICFMGDFSREVPPAAQLRAGAHLVAWLMQKLALALDDVRGHGELLKIECPGAQWLSGRKWKQMLRQEVVSVQQEMKDSVVAIGAKPIYHYMLFWATDDKWAELDWANARDYVAAFRPSLGFSAHDAAQAEYVTIVGGPLGVSRAVELWLRSKGCKVDRIAGKDELDTKQILDKLVQSGRRFVSLEG